MVSGMTKDDLVTLQDAMKTQWRRIDRIASNKFSVGDPVTWSHTRSDRIIKMSGVVSKVNDVTCKVTTALGVWTVSSGMLFHDPAPTE
jgi:hypothetical protein